jgi:hypothetical protein
MSETTKDLIKQLREEANDDAEVTQAIEPIWKKWPTYFKSRMGNCPPERRLMLFEMLHSIAEARLREEAYKKEQESAGNRLTRISVSGPTQQRPDELARRLGQV